MGRPAEVVQIGRALLTSLVSLPSQSQGVCAREGPPRTWLSGGLGPQKDFCVSPGPGPLVTGWEVLIKARGEMEREEDPVRQEGSG